MTIDTTFMKPPKFYWVRYPVAFHTVDILPYTFEDGVPKLFFGIKNTNPEQIVTIGGFVDPEDDSAEGAVLREFYEEAGVDFRHLSKPFPNKQSYTLNVQYYIGSFKIDDERYQEEPHKIITSFFGVLLSKDIVLAANDDLTGIAKYDFDYVRDHYKQIVVPKHHILIEAFLNSHLW